jgi:hypothetical protein
VYTFASTRLTERMIPLRGEGDVMDLQRRHKKTAHSRRSLAWLTVGIALVVAAPVQAGEKTKTVIKHEGGQTIVRIEVDTEVCDRCELQAGFVEQLKKLHATAEIAEIKKGVVVFYTTPNERNVDALQDMIEEAVEGIEEINEEAEHLHLCEFCLASMDVYARLHRELLETSQGMMLLITGDDAEAIVAVKKMFRVYRSHGYREQYYGEQKGTQALKDE